MRRSPKAHWILAACVALTGCMAQLPSKPTGPAPEKERVLKSGLAAKVAVKRADGFFPAESEPPAAGVVSNNGGSIVSNNAGSLTGRVMAPPGLLSNNGAGIISNNSGGYRVLAGAPVPVAGVEVELVTAGGQPVLDEAGKPIVAETDAEGQYRMPFSGNTANLISRVVLPEDKGSLLAFVARGEREDERRVDLDLTSTLVMGYILGQYVKGDQKILEKLPADVEAETRTKMAAAVIAFGVATPQALTGEQVAKTVSQLRTQDLAIDVQLEKVKRILLVGLSDQGAGLPATEVETDAVALAISPEGALHYGGNNTARVWKMDAQGRLRQVAGTGRGSEPLAQADTPAPGDGGPALQAPIQPAAIAFDAAGRLYIADRFQRRVRRVDAAGVIETYAASNDWQEPKALAFEPDGTLLVGTPTRIDRVKPDRTIVPFAGGEKGTPAAGPIGALRFKGLEGLAVAPDGTIYALDRSAYVLRLAGGTASIVAGTGQAAPATDGPGTASGVAGMGGLATDASGNLYLADHGNRLVRRLTPSGTIETLAGTGEFGFKGDGGPAKQARMVNPRAVAVAADGAVYTADTGFVRKVAGGTLTTVIGKLKETAVAAPVDSVQLRNPQGLLYDPEAHALYYGELWRLRRWDLATDMVETVASDGLLGTPWQDGQSAMSLTLFNFKGLARGADGAIYYLADDPSFKRRLIRQKDGKVTSLAGGGADCDPFSLLLAIDTPAAEACIPTLTWPLALAGDRLLYSTNIEGFGLDLVMGFVPGGNLGEVTRTKGNARITALALEPDGKHLIIGALGQIIRFDMETKETVVITKDGGAASPDALGVPTGLAFDNAGRLYFSDYATDRVRRYDPATGQIVAIAGKGAPLLDAETVDGGLSGPYGLAFDRDGNLYVADMGHNQIKKIEAAKL